MQRGRRRLSGAACAQLVLGGTARSGREALLGWRTLEVLAPLKLHAQRSRPLLGRKRGAGGREWRGESWFAGDYVANDSASRWRCRGRTQRSR